jgi:hypothetical protein
MDIEILLLGMLERKRAMGESFVTCARRNGMEFSFSEIRWQICTERFKQWGLAS